MDVDVRRTCSAGSATMAMVRRLASLALLAGLALAACKGRSSAVNKPAGVNCETAATAYVGRHELELNVGNQIHAMAETAIDLCTKRQWTETVRGCLKSAQSASSSEACFTDRAALVELLDALHIRRTQLAEAATPPSTAPSPSAPSPSPSAPSPSPATPAH